MRSARIDLRVPPADKQDWQAQADALGLELSELIRQAVPHYVKASKRQRRKQRKPQTVS